MMARTFDNNVANYMSRASVNLGLNGLTEFSLAAWVYLQSTAVTDEIVNKMKNVVGFWRTFAMDRPTAGSSVLRVAIENEALNQFPEWRTAAQVPLGVWLRVLFTWKRNAITSADGIWYVNGSSVSITFTANGYGAAFTLEEVSNTLYYGLREGPASPLDGKLAWASVWNRQLTAQEAVDDYVDPKAVFAGLVHRVELCPDHDQAPLANNMTVNGTLACAAGPLLGPSVTPGTDDGDSFQMRRVSR